MKNGCKMSIQNEFRFAIRTVAEMETKKETELLTRRSFLRCTAAAAATLALWQRDAVADGRLGQGVILDAKETQ